MMVLRHLSRLTVDPERSRIPAYCVPLVQRTKEGMSEMCDVPTRGSGEMRGVGCCAACGMILLCGGCFAVSVCERMKGEEVAQAERLANQREKAMGAVGSWLDTR